MDQLNQKKLLPERILCSFRLLRYSETQSSEFLTVLANITLGVVK